ncbi:MAG: aromatic-ring-hydroxylating dioxygenase subunit beta [Alphaproteobacteria bacterium]
MPTSASASSQHQSMRLSKSNEDWCRFEELFPHREVEAFLFEEAALLDAWKLDEWLALFEQSAQYVVPTTDLPDGDPENDLVFIDDNFIRLQGRVTRLKSGTAHREHPFSRTRRFISNIRVVGVNDGIATIKASFIVYRFKGGPTEPFVGEYVYRLARAAGGLKILYRRATLDQESLQVQGAVSIIL